MNKTVKKITACAAACALLIAVQLLLSPVAGVELVTALFLCFCTVYGVALGCLTATAFSLLRCLLFGFAPNVLLLYLVYYNLFAVLFGFLGRRKRPVAVWVAPLILALLAGASAFFAAYGVPVTALKQGQLTAMLWTLFGLFSAILLLYFILLACRRGECGRELSSVVALAALCTVCFTLLDDCITPLYYGWTLESALAYFYASFLAMVPQTVCTVLSTSFLFYPLKKTFSTTAKWLGKCKNGK